MYGLAKIADELNFNYSSREDRLLDEVEDAREKLLLAESRRNPELVDRANEASAAATLKGIGIGAALGAGFGGLAAASGFRAKAGLVGGVAGGLTGSIPGIVVGTYRKDNILQEDDPEVLSGISDAIRDVASKQERLERHYLTKQRIMEEEERRQQLRGY